MIERPTLLRILLTFLRIGATAYGGVWASARRIERAAVDDNDWLDRDEVRSLLLVSTVIPAPKFVAMVALIGQRVRGIPGGIAAAIGLFAPTGTMIVLAASFVRPDLLTGVLAPLAESIGIAVVGLLVGNALRQWGAGESGMRNRIAGSAISLTMVALMVFGVPIVVVAVGGFLIGPLLVRA